MSVGWKLSLRGVSKLRRPLVVIAATLAACARVAGAQSGWEARVTMAPNPLPAGRCGDIRLELVDDHGYRRTTLSNGALIDTRNFRFAISDPSHVTVQNDASVAGRVCADTGVAASTTTVTVTLPDGLTGTLQIVLVPKGQVGPRPIVYRSQAPLRLPTSPEFAPGFVRAKAMARAKGVSGGGAAGAGAADPATNPAAVGAAGAADPATDPGAVGAVGAADPATDPGAVGAVGAADPATDPGAVGAVGTTGTTGAAGAAVRAPAASGKSVDPSRRSTIPSKVFPQLAPVTVTTPPIAMTGTYHVLAAVFVTTPTLAMAGTYRVLPPVLVTTPTLSMAGTYHVLPPVLVTTPPLSMAGTYPAHATTIDRSHPVSHKPATPKPSSP
jgi:hypothetical protein